MSKIILNRIGKPVGEFIDSDTYKSNSESMQRINKKYENILNEIKSGWGNKYIERVHKKGKLTAWERIELLKDKNSDIFPIGSFVNYGKKFGDPGSEKFSPGAGVITAFIKVSGKYITVIANDNTVASGSWWPNTPEKIQRAQEVSLKLKIPVVYLIDSSGLFLPEQANTFPGRYGAGHIFKMNSKLSDAQVPQIAGVFGDCIAGGGYMPIISDIVYMTEQAYMVIAGAALIKGAKSQKITSLSIGGPDVHVHISGCADYRVPDDETLLKKIKSEIDKLPSSGTNYYRYGGGFSEPSFPAEEIKGIFPSNYRMNYDMKQIIARLVDNSLFREIYPEKGEEIICGIGKINGLYCGIIANNTLLIPNKRIPGEMKPGGILYKEGISKITSFIRSCDSDGIPLVWLQDISGFDIGQEAEKDGLLGYGSNLLYSISNLSTPVFTILLRKASGAGYYAMNGLPFDPVLQLSTPITRLSVMDGKTLAIGAFNTKLDDNFKIVATDKKEYDEIERGMKEVEERIERDMDPLVSASQMDTDEIVTLDKLRPYLEMLMELSYQSTGYRRIKNPRIWSIHDLINMSGSTSQDTDRNSKEKKNSSEIGKHSDSDIKKNSSEIKAVDLKENEIIISSFTSGIFYSKPSPDSSPFVSKGTRIKNGSVLGLIEVMKSFNHITFKGKTENDEGEVIRIIAKDSSEVKSGDPLFLISITKGGKN